MYKYYSALQETDGYQVLPRPLYLHNDNAGAITLDIKPFPENSVITSFAATNTSVVSLFPAFSPQLKQAQVATQYTATTISGIGKGAKITTTVTETQNGKIATFPSTMSFTGNNVGADLAEYTPTTDGSGTGFVVRFSNSGTPPFAPQNVNIISQGTGYEVGDELTFVVGGETIVGTLVTANIGLGFLVTAATSSAIGDNYAAGDIIEITLAETFDTVEYTYPIRLTITNDVLKDAGAVPLKLNAGETSVVPALEFEVQGAADKSVLALLAEPI